MIDPRLEDWRPGSFTKNFSWGEVSRGLKKLHEAIRVGFDNKVENVTRASFRRRIRDSQLIDYVPLNFFLFNCNNGGMDWVVADELVFQAIEFRHSKEFDKLALFAFNLSIVGTWKGSSSFQTRPAGWANHYVRDRVGDQYNWDTKLVSADDIERFVTSDLRYVAKTARKLATNLNYLYKIGRLNELSGKRVERWWINAIFLALDRILLDGTQRGIVIGEHAYEDRLASEGFSFLTGRRSIDKDLAIPHLIALYTACGSRERFSDESVRERQAIRLPDLNHFANDPSPVGAVHRSNGQLAKAIPRVCAMLAYHLADFDIVELSGDSFDVTEYIKSSTRKALGQLTEAGIQPTMTAENLMQQLRG